MPRTFRKVKKAGSMSRQPKRDLRRKQQRKKKLHYLRARLARTQDLAERRRLIAKIKKISPAAPVPEK
jgi:indole-3-glycerol phosphate synthase